MITGGLRLELARSWALFEETDDKVSHVLDQPLGLLFRQPPVMTLDCEMWAAHGSAPPQLEQKILYGRMRPEVRMPYRCVIPIA